MDKSTTLSPRARRALLEQAPVIERALAEITRQLDVRSDTCPSCHLHVMRSYRESQLAALVESTRHKLSKWQQEARQTPCSAEPAMTP